MWYIRAVSVLGRVLLVAALAMANSCSRSAIRQSTAEELCAERCDDGVFCNGAETCDPQTGACLSGLPERCDDDDECTIDDCEVATDVCSHRESPRDDDRDTFNACGGDCDDMDPTIYPGAEELCDDVDQDCDGMVDEQLLSECGDCRPGCRIVDLPGIGPWEPTEDNSDSVVEDGDGALVLHSEMDQRFDAWIANSRAGRVTKLDTRDGRQLAAYHSVLTGPDNDARDHNSMCDDGLGGDEGNCPSRTAVDLLGAVYVANRNFGGQGTVTKIAGFPDDCADRDGDGEITTSEDINGNGTIDFEVEGEFVGQADECILWTVNVGGRDSIPRALTVAADGNVWVGLNGDHTVVELSPSDGRVLSTVPTPAFDPYGAAIDGEGRIWFTEALTGKILSVDTNTNTAGTAITAPEIATGCPSSYGIAVDASGKVWIPGFTCPYAFGYDPKTGDWTSVPIPDSGVTRGIAADDRGRIYVSSSHDSIEIEQDHSSVFIRQIPERGLSRLTVFDSDGGNMQVFGTNEDPLPGQMGIGVGLDSQRRAWIVNQESGTATLVDPSDGTVEAYPAGPGPYTYSDFTGFSLRKLFARNGEIEKVVEGCELGPSEWEQVTWNADLPAGSRIEIRLRAASTLEELPGKQWLGPWNDQPIDLFDAPGPIAEGRYLGVEARLVSGPHGGTPVLRNVTFRVHCPI